MQYAACFAGPALLITIKDPSPLPNSPNTILQFFRWLDLPKDLLLLIGGYLERCLADARWWHPRKNPSTCGHAYCSCQHSFISFAALIILPFQPFPNCWMVIQLFQVLPSTQPCTLLIWKGKIHRLRLAFLLKKVDVKFQASLPEGSYLNTRYCWWFPRWWLKK